MHCSRRLIVQTLVFSLSYLHRQVSPPETLVVKGGATWARNGRWILPENARLPSNIQGSFKCRKSTTWDKRLYFPSERRRAEASAGYEPANLGTKGQHVTSRPPKPLPTFRRHHFLWKRRNHSSNDTVKYPRRTEPLITHVMASNFTIHKVMNLFPSKILQTVLHRSSNVFITDKPQSMLIHSFSRIRWCSRSNVYQHLKM